jgi:hypothetical protein
VAFADLIRFPGRRMGAATPGRQLHRAKHGAGIRSGCRTRIEARLSVPLLATRSVPRYRFEICEWFVPTYRLDWIVLGYSWCRPLAPPMNADGRQWRPHYPLLAPPLAPARASKSLNG